MYILQQQQQQQQQQQKKRMSVVSFVALEIQFYWSKAIHTTCNDKGFLYIVR
jgi:hypothetical protein